MGGDTDATTVPLGILITGGTGFIGSRLALHARSMGHRPVVLGLVRNPAEEANLRELRAASIAVEHVDIGGDGIPERLFDGIDAVVHLAAAQHEMNIPDARFREVNVEGTGRLLEAARAAGVGRFVYGSTIGVYGHHRGIADEETPPAPDNIYGRTKLEAERLVLATREGIAVTAVRIAETYGPGDWRLLKMFRAVQKGRFPLIGSGRNVHHPIYVDDLVRGLLTLCRHPAAVGELFVMAGPEAVTTAQMIEAVAAALHRSRTGPRLPLWPFLLAATAMEAVLRPLGIQPPLHRRRLDFFTKSFALRTEKARRLLGWEPGIGFAEGARRTAAWYHEHGLLDADGLRETEAPEEESPAPGG